MKYENYFEERFKSTPDYRKIVLLIYIIKNDGDLLNECGLLKSDTNRLCLEFQIILMD